jgi:hypothetical protein
MKRHAERAMGDDVVYTATQERCPDCDRVLPVYQNDGRRVQGLDTVFWMKRRDKRCQPDCPGPRPIWYAPRDLRVVLPQRIYGLEVTLYVGERHLLDGISLCQITRELNQRGALIDQRHTGRVFRDFVSLTQLARGDEAAVQTRLRAQGGIVLMCDGVQFDERSPVLYLVWDAISGEPLFGERKPYRSQADLMPLLERVRAMGVPVIGAVTDKEKGLVPAVTQVFPHVPYQYCQTHFLKNCAKPLHADLAALQASVRRRADAVREIGKLVAPSASAVPPTVEVAARVASPLTEPASEPVHTPVALEREAQSSAAEAMSELELVRQVCELVRVNSRVSGKAPLDPAELKRHERLEAVRALVNEARKKKAPTTRATTRGPCSIASPRRSRPPGMKHAQQVGSSATPRFCVASRMSCPTPRTEKDGRRVPPRRRHVSKPICTS